MPKAKLPLAELESHVVALASDTGFVHHKWFVTHHLRIVEKLVRELCILYPGTNQMACRALVWLHDIGKIITNDAAPGPEELTATLAESRVLLSRFGFSAEVTTLCLLALRQMEEIKNTPLRDITLETKIISSADAASHFIGPFFNLYWYENPDKPIDELIALTLCKLTRDHHKILLPEAENFVAPRMRFISQFAPENQPSGFFK